jgi:hypothetical protein
MARTVSAWATIDRGAKRDITTGSTNATAVTIGWSGLWQQDIEQFSTSPMSCSQSMCEFCDAGVFG